MGMIINHNLSALNTFNKLSANNALMNKSLEKLSSGYRINTAADDAAGLAISEKMRGQIRGLDQAKSNSQDAISMTQTAEGALDETTSILQRMRELSVKASTDTLTDSNRTAVQDEIDALTSEINRIGNTTSFNTKSLLKGDGSTNLGSTSLVSVGTSTTGGAVAKTQASMLFDKLTVKAGTTASNSFKTVVGGETLTINLVNDATMSADGAAIDTSSATGNSITVKYKAAADTDISTVLGNAVSSMISKNSTLANNWKVTNPAAEQVKIEAVKDGAADGAAGTIGVGSMTDATTTFWKAAPVIPSAGVMGTTTETKASTQIDLSSINSVTKATALLGKGFTINGKQVEFYDADAGAYTGTAIGINISSLVNTGATVTGAKIADAIVEQANGKIDGVLLSTDTTNNKLTVTATATGDKGNGINVKDGGVQEAFKATFQIGANTGQTMSLSINDMRAKALTVSSTTAGGSITVKDSEGKDVTASYKAAKNVTDGTSDTSIEYSLDLSTADKATAAISVIDQATTTVSAERSKMGAVINRLEHTINNLTTSSENLTSAESNIRDVDMASEMAKYTNKSVLNQAATAMLAKANQQPQQVLTLLQG
ncbi:hypothetical protein SRRS_09570 [Sporomusa rhizae]|uniref:flagellin N-terminal helical domain-containing protein n=1 Tax=Sporomusa rhizae TaxID=357999 RepID=UPI00352B3B6B